MSDSPLDQACARARDRLARDGDGHLPLGARQGVWTAMGPRGDAGARLRRTALAAACVAQTRPLWDARYPGNPLPGELLAVIGALVRGEVDPEEAEEMSEHGWNNAMYLAGEEPHPAVGVGLAAAQALGVALYDERFDADGLDEDRPDGDDPESFDASFYAAAAQAGGLPGDPDSDPARRRAFWEWWLDQASRPRSGPDPLAAL
jgi:hypothetical protein